MDDVRFMRRAIELSASCAKSDEGPFGAVVVREGRIIGEGVNRVVPTGDPTAHAEIIAIRAACQEIGSHVLDGAVIYTSCEPCPMCLGAIYWAHIRCIYYSNTRADAARIGFDDDSIYREIGIPPDRRKIPAVRIVSETSDLAFSEWARSPEKQRY